MALAMHRVRNMACMSHSVAVSDCVAEALEGRQNFFRKELRLLPGGEVSALVELVVVDELGIRALGPTPRSWVSSSGKTLTGIEETSRSLPSAHAHQHCAVE